MKLPEARGPITEALFAHMLATRSGKLEVSVGLSPNVLDDDDFQLALWVLYEVHHRSFSDVVTDWEWDPGLLALRGELEDQFERELHSLVRTQLVAVQPSVGSVAFAERFFDLVNGYPGPSLANWVHREATRAQILEFLINRSIYQLKEADPHCWVIPRLDGPAKSALVELQFDEYGDGRPGRTHAELFATTLREAGLNPDYGAYIDAVGAATLAANNVVSLFALHRRHRSASMGHLAAYEATSSLPCRRYAAGLRRAGFSALAAEYFDEHVEADAVHEQLAVRTICAQLVEDDPANEVDVFFGALCALALEARVAAGLMAGRERPETAAEPAPAAL